MVDFYAVLARAVYGRSAVLGPSSSRERDARARRAFRNSRARPHRCPREQCRSLRGQSFWDISVQEWERVHAVNVRSVFLCAKAAAEHVQIPVSLREELHLKVPDASGIAYRRFSAG